MGTQTNPRLRAAGNAHLSNALGCECVLTTADKKFVLMKRSKDVAFASGLYNGPSGHAEPQYVWNKNIVGRSCETASSEKSSRRSAYQRKLCPSRG